MVKPAPSVAECQMGNGFLLTLVFSSETIGEGGITKIGRFIPIALRNWTQVFLGLRADFDFARRYARH